MVGAHAGYGWCSSADSLHSTSMVLWLHVSFVKEMPLDEVKKASVALTSSAVQNNTADHIQSKSVAKLKRESK